MKVVGHSDDEMMGMARVHRKRGRLRLRIAGIVQRWCRIFDTAKWEHSFAVVEIPRHSVGLDA